MHRTSRRTQAPYRLRPALTLATILITVAAFAAPFRALARTRMMPLETERVPAGGSVIHFKTSLDAGELFLLKATGTAKVGRNVFDAEYGGFGPRMMGRDVMGGADVGVEVAVPTQETVSGAKPWRTHWFGGYRPDHTYYMIVNGAGLPPMLRLRAGGGTGSGAITVSLYRLSPSAASLPKPLENLQVPVLERVVPTSLTTRPGVVYLLQASGSGHVGGGGIAQGDAEYMDYNAEGAGATDIGDAHTDYGLGVDEADQAQSPRLRKWGPWRKDHTYYMLFAGTGRPIHFFFYDVKGGYGDNSPTDALTVRVFPVP